MTSEQSLFFFFWFYTHCRFSALPAGEFAVGPPARTVYTLNQYYSHADMDAATLLTPFPAGGTMTSEGIDILAIFHHHVSHYLFPPFPLLLTSHPSPGLKHARTNIFTPEGGARDSSLGVPRVLVVLTDGQATPGYEPATEAAALRANSVTILAVGVGDYDYAELRSMATDMRYIYELTGFSALSTFAKSLAPATCFAPSPLDSEGPTQVVLDRDHVAYYQVTCAPLPTQLAISMRVTSGTAAIFIAVGEPAPGPRRYDLMAVNVTAAEPVRFTVDRAALAKGATVTDSAPGVFVAVVATAPETRLRLQVSKSSIAGLPAAIGVSEAAALSTEIARPAAAAGSGQRFSILSRNGDGLFAIDPVSGALTLQGHPDYEMTQRHLLTIVLGPADGLGGPCQSSVADVEIRILDANDNAPYFYQPPHIDVAITSLSLAVQETAQSSGGSGAALSTPRRLGRVYARDVDSGLFGDVVFGLQDPVPEGFGIDAATGELWTTQALDFEQKANYTFRVTARDSGEPPLSASPLLEVTLFVLDIIDEAPQFAADHFYAKVEAVGFGGREGRREANEQMQ